MKRIIFVVLLAIIHFWSCTTGINRSKDPGVIRVNLQSDPTDTTITILGKIYSVDSTSIFNIYIFEAKAYIDSNYSFLVPRLTDYYDDGRYYNILEMEETTYKKYKIYESFAPPDKYDRLQFGLTASTMKIGEYKIPVELPPDENVLLDFYDDFEIYENDTTEINIQIAPFRSVERYRDSYLFNREVNIVSVNYLRR